MFSWINAAKERMINAVNDTIIWLMITAGGLNELSEQQSLKTQIAGYSTLGDWQARNVVASGAVGGVSGAIGGPWAYAAEFGDLTYVLRTAARGAIGVGLLKGRTVDYENDMAMIVAVWSGAADIADKVAAGKVAVIVGASSPAMLASSVHLTAKIVAKAAMKNHAAASYIAKKVTTKILAKYGAKLSTKWIPVIGGVSSAAVNAWIVSTIIDAADKYYSSKFIVFDDSVPISEP